jgi:alpha-tubulin suppressor-like RCC1 family protein
MATVWTWGYNIYGQLGDGTTTSRSTPAAVNGLAGISAIGAGDDHSLAVSDNGNVYAWGYNNQGQLGNGTYTNSSTPVQVSGLSSAVFSQVLTSNGTIYAWGLNTYGQLGNGTTAQR